MASLTPKHREQEVTSAAMSEGLLNGAMVMFPAMGGLYAAMQNPSFVKYTNWQSRTAMVIMPALFTFALTSEQKMLHRMEEVAEETEHNIKSVEWADRHHRKSVSDNATSKKAAELRALYRQSVLNSGIRVVEENELTVPHRVANFVQSNPFKCIAGIGVPAVAYIFHTRQGKEHRKSMLLVLAEKAGIR